MIVSFVPLVVFALLAGLSRDLALWAAFAAAFAVSLRDFAREQVLHLLDVGALAIFGAAALFAGFVRPGLSIGMTRFAVDAGFFGLALLSLVLRKPLTLQARGRTPPPGWSKRHSVLTHYGLTAFWALGFAAMAAADALADMHKNIPSSLDGAAGLAVLLLGLAVTARYSGPATGDTAGDPLHQPGFATLAVSRIAARNRDALHR
ncbi:MAG TPA: hypothetical protein VGL35_12435 [Rhizomicrobium sp.]|jgi:hypothetical protein